MRCLLYSGDDGSEEERICRSPTRRSYQGCVDMQKKRRTNVTSLCMIILYAVPCSYHLKRFLNVLQYPLNSDVLYRSRSRMGSLSSSMTGSVGALNLIGFVLIFPLEFCSVAFPCQYKLPQVQLLLSREGQLSLFIIMLI